MIVSINRDGVCMGDDAMDHRRDIEMEDRATGRDLLEKLLEMNYLPDLSDAIWYTWSLRAPCIVAWSCKKKKIIAELKNVPLMQIDSNKTWYDFRHLLKEGLYLLRDDITNTPGIWYDKDFFGGHI
jgi:hypothetical protein